MAESNKRGYSIVARNLPPDFSDTKLREIFSQYGTILSTKILPPNDFFPGAYSFVNFQDPESCQAAVINVDGMKIGHFTLHVFAAASRNTENKNDGIRNRSNDEVSARDGSNSDMRTPSSAFNRVNSQQGLSPFQPKLMINSIEVEKSNLSKSSSSPINPMFTPPSAQILIPPHESFVVNQTYDIYLSNRREPNVVFVATLNDYVRATLFIQTMNQIEKTVQSKGNSYDSKLTIGQICAAMYQKSWYRAKVMEVGENRVGVKLIDWGNTHFCDPTLETRPLAEEYLNEPALCMKCILDGVPSNEKLTAIQKKLISDILVLDVKLTMTVVRIENDVPYIQLNRHQRNLNQEIRNVLFPSTIRTTPSISFETNHPDVNPVEPHNVQITHYDTQSQCFRALLLRESLVTVINMLKDWSQKKIIAKDQIQPGILVCVQSEEDDLWYRGWIRSVAERACRIYFVDFGNEELIAMDRICECPEVLRTISWLNIPIRLNNFPIDDNEREELWKQFQKYERLTMKIIGLKKDIYTVELLANDKLMTEFLSEFRKKKVPSTPPIQSQGVRRPASVMQPPSATRAAIQTATTTVSAATNIIKTLPNSVVKIPTEQTNHDSPTNDQIKEMLIEQRKQYKLLERVLAAINTTNSLLAQLVQRDANHSD